MAKFDPVRPVVANFILRCGVATHRRAVIRLAIRRGARKLFRCRFGFGDLLLAETLCSIELFGKAVCRHSSPRARLRSS
jgi:hypothetical protein